eukprot:364581-Chlamydomonas_euryale.AAC.1
MDMHGLSDGSPLAPGNNAGTSGAAVVSRPPCSAPPPGTLPGLPAPPLHHQTLPWLQSGSCCGMACCEQQRVTGAPSARWQRGTRQCWRQKEKQMDQQQESSSRSKSCAGGRPKSGSGDD